MIMNKKNLILGGILILLIAAAYIYNGPFKKWQAGSGKPKNPLAGIEMDKLDKIEIFRLNSTTILEKIGDKWKIGGTKNFYSKIDSVNSLLNVLKEAETADIEIASENKNKKAEFNVDDISGINLQLSVATKVRTNIMVGKMGLDYSGCYISSANEEKIYYLKANLRSYLDLEDWRDNIIFSNDKTKINKVRFQFPNQQFTIEKKGDQWSTVSSKPVALDSGKVDEILSLMSSLTAAKIPEQNFKVTGLEKSQIIVQATGEGLDNTIMVGNESAKGSNLYFAKRGNSDNIYLITKDDRDKLNKKIQNFK